MIACFTSVGSKGTEASFLCKHIIFCHKILPVSDIVSLKSKAVNTSCKQLLSQHVSASGLIILLWGHCIELEFLTFFLVIWSVPLSFRFHKFPWEMSGKVLPVVISSLIWSLIWIISIVSKSKSKFISTHLANINKKTPQSWLFSWQGISGGNLTLIAISCHCLLYFWNSGWK